MEVIKILLLAILEGLTEFLPISSTGHLIIFEEFMSISVPFAYELIFQLGAFIAVLFYFRERIEGILKSLVKFLRVRHLDVMESKDRFNILFFSYILLSVIPILIVGGLFLSEIEEYTHKSEVVLVIMLLFTFVMLFFDRSADEIREIEDIKFRDIVSLGLWQVLSVVPGVSRSGAVITGGISLGFTRKDAAEMSFLIGILPIVLSGLKGIVDLIDMNSYLNVDYSVVLLGFIVSFIVSFVVIDKFLKFLENHSLSFFIKLRFVEVVIFGAILFFLT